MPPEPAPSRPTDVSPTGATEVSIRAEGDVATITVEKQASTRIFTVPTRPLVAT